MRKIIELPIEETKAVVGGATLAASYTTSSTLVASSTITASTSYKLPVYQQPILTR